MLLKKNFSTSCLLQGFTLLEIMVVVVIIGILAALAFPRLSGRREQARRWKAMIEIRELQQAVEAFYYDTGYYPSQEEGLQMLQQEKIDSSGNDIAKKYLRRDSIPVDPWGNNYSYLFPGLGSERYSIVSFGKDGKQGGDKWNRDIVSWELDNEQ